MHFYYNMLAAKSVKNGLVARRGQVDDLYAAKKKDREVLMAEPTRLELATSAVTGQRSNQLSYDSVWLYYNALF